MLRARVNKAPGYQVGFSYGTVRRPSTGRDVLVVPEERPGVRDGLQEDAPWVAAQSAGQ